MSATEPPLPAQAGSISQADWQATPLVVRQLVLTLLATVERLQQEVAQLPEQVNKNAHNSSKPHPATRPR
ncbi:MAG: hypothetical protein HS099_13260 [Ardenticatenaceae bacterium]|nr:hypothetical protein [Ardenticatenaceae bacterium]